MLGRFLAQKYNYIYEVNLPPAHFYPSTYRLHWSYRRGVHKYLFTTTKQSAVAIFRENCLDFRRHF